MPDLRIDAGQADPLHAGAEVADALREGPQILRLTSPFFSLCVCVCVRVRFIYPPAIKNFGSENMTYPSSSGGSDIGGASWSAPQPSGFFKLRSVKVDVKNDVLEINGQAMPLWEGRNEWGDHIFLLDVMTDYVAKRYDGTYYRFLSHRSTAHEITEEDMAQGTIKYQVEYEVVPITEKQASGLILREVLRRFRAGTYLAK